MPKLFRSAIETPVGPMLALASNEAVCALEFTDRRRISRLDARLERWFPRHEIEDRTNPILARLRRWLDDYFDAGPENDPPPLDMRGTAFEGRVWAALRQIPPGTTTTYGHIAAQIGSAGAARAVGLANRSNPIAIIVPCHRVIGSTGDLTGYGGGLDRKAWLLNHEARWRRVPDTPGACGRQRGGD